MNQSSQRYHPWAGNLNIKIFWALHYSSARKYRIRFIQTTKTFVATELRFKKFKLEHDWGTCEWVCMNNDVSSINRCSDANWVVRHTLVDISQKLSFFLVGKIWIFNLFYCNLNILDDFNNSVWGLQFIRSFPFLRECIEIINAKWEIFTCVETRDEGEMCFCFRCLFDHFLWENEQHWGVKHARVTPTNY